MRKEYLQECFKYDKKTGSLYWKERPLHHFKNINAMKWTNSRFANSLVGNIKNTERSNTSYYITKVNNKHYAVHRLIWEMHYGKIPDEMQIDHIDNNGINNRLENLRLVSQSLNQKNRPLQKSNKSGVNGVNWHKAAKKWQVRIVDNNGKRIDLGRYDSFEDAIIIRKTHEKKYGYLQ